MADGTASDSITLAEAAERLGVHYMTAYRYVRTGRLAAEKMGTQWHVDPDLLASFDPGRRPAGPATKQAAAEQLLARLTAGDQAGCWRLCEDMLASGATAISLYEDVLIPTMTEIGDRWEAGTLSVSEEHVASALVQRLLGRLGPSFSRRGIKRGSVIVGAPSGDFHSLPTAFVADLLRGRGFEVIDLGANTPGESFGRVAASTGRLVAVGLAVSAPLDRADIRGTITEIRSAELGVPIVVGGGTISTAAEGEALGADFGSTGADDFLAIIDTLAAADEQHSAAVG